MLLRRYKIVISTGAYALLRTRSGETCSSAFAVAIAFVFLVVILTLSVAEGEEPASRSRSERPFLPFSLQLKTPSS
jgi:hypothetical protein